MGIAVQFGDMDGYVISISFENISFLICILCIQLVEVLIKLQLLYMNRVEMIAYLNYT